MRLCRFDENRLGVVVGERVHDVSEALGRLPAARYPFPPHDALIAGLEALCPELERLAAKACAWCTSTGATTTRLSSRW